MLALAHRDVLDDGRRVIRGRTARVLLAAWIALLVAILVPWFDVTDHTHWSKVNWIPLGPPLRPFDIVANFAVFVPYGLLWRRSAFRSLWLGLPVAFALGVLLSVSAEAAQLYSHSRIPSATDVATNAVGIVVGWWGTRTESS